MSRRVLAFASLGLSGGAALLLACNAILGIGAATREPAEGGAAPDEGGESGGSSGGDAGTAVMNPYHLDCATYCAVMQQNCRNENLTDNQEYLSPPDTACTTICPLFESVAVEGGTVDKTEATPMTNTLNCRIWHANAAAGDPHVHCPHAGPLGGNMCQDPGGACEEFCNLDLAICVGDAAAYPSVTDCMNGCLPDAGGYPGFPYNVNPTDNEVSDLASSGNSLNCRMYHLENYLFTGEALHCSHTAQSGGGVCVDPN